MTRRRQPLRGVARLDPPRPAGSTPPAAAAGLASKPAQAPRPPRAPVVLVLDAAGRVDCYYDRDAADVAIVRLPPLRENAAVEALRDALVWLSVPLRHRPILYPRNRTQAHILQCPPSVRALAEAEFLREVHRHLNDLATALQPAKEGSQ